MFLLKVVIYKYFRKFTSNFYDCFAFNETVLGFRIIVKLQGKLSQPELPFTLDNIQLEGNHDETKISIFRGSSQRT